MIATSVRVATGYEEFQLYIECQHVAFNNCSFLHESMYMDYAYGLMKLLFVDSLGLAMETKLSSGGYGHGYSIQNSSGMVRDIAVGNADTTTTDFDMTYDRSLVISYGPVLTYTNRVLIVNYLFSSNMNHFKYWTAFSPVCSMIWIIFLLSLWISTKDLYCFSRSLDRRMLRLILSISFLIFNAIFGGRLIETRSVSVAKLPFAALQNSVSAIENSKFRLIFELGGNAGQTSIKQEERYKLLREALKKHPILKFASRFLGYQISTNEKYFTYASKVFALSIAMRYPGRIKYLQDHESTTMVQAIAYDKQNMKLGWKLARASLAVLETGHVKRLQQKIYKNSVDRYEIICGKQAMLSSRNDLPIRLLDLAYTYVAAGFMMSLAVMVALFELFLNRIFPS